jgi:hypothetical protein
LKRRWAATKKAGVAVVPAAKTPAKKAKKRHISPEAPATTKPAKKKAAAAVVPVTTEP